MKKLTIMLLVAVIGMGTVSCADTKREEGKKDIARINEIDFVVPRGVTSIGLSTMIEEDANIAVESEENDVYDFEYEILESTDALMGSVMKGEPDIAVVPSNVAVKAYNQEIPYKLLGTLGFGSLYLISTVDYIKFEDLKGKEIYNVGKGLTPDIVLKTLLKENNVSENDVTFNYVATATELAPMILSKKAKYAVVPEPALSTIIEKNPDIKILASLNDMWKDAFDSSLGYPQSSIIIKNEVLENDSEFVKKLVTQIDENVDKVNDKKQEAVSAEVKNGSKVEEKIIESSVERANLDFVVASQCKDAYLAYYDILLKMNPKSVGDKMPDENFFYEE